MSSLEDVAGLLSHVKSLAEADYHSLPKPTDTPEPGQCAVPLLLMGFSIIDLVALFEHGTESDRKRNIGDRFKELLSNDKFYHRAIGDGLTVDKLYETYRCGSVHEFFAKDSCGIARGSRGATTIIQSSVINADALFDWAISLLGQQIGRINKGHYAQRQTAMCEILDAILAGNTAFQTAASAAPGAPRQVRP